MYTVESAGENEVVVAVEFLEARCEGAVVDQAACFVYDEEGEDDPNVSCQSDLIDVYGPIKTHIMAMAVLEDRMS